MKYRGFCITLVAMTTRVVTDELFQAVRSDNLQQVKQLLQDNPDLDVNQADETSMHILQYVCYLGFTQLAIYLIDNCPTIKLNLQNSSGWSPLMYACYKGNDDVVATLLSQPSIDVNISSQDDGATPLNIACFWGNVQCVRLLLEDRRTDVSKADKDGSTGLHAAASQGHLEVTKYYLATVDINSVSWGQPGCSKTGVIEAAKKYFWNSYPKPAEPPESLLAAYKADPATVRQRLRQQLGLTDQLAADVFALIIFLCDDLLVVRQSPIVDDEVTTNRRVTSTKRLFNIVAKLPMEIQMIICYRIDGSSKCNIKTVKSEAAFRSLARSLSIRT